MEDQTQGLNDLGTTAERLEVIIKGNNKRAIISLAEKFGYPEHVAEFKKSLEEKGLPLVLYCSEHDAKLMKMAFDATGITLVKVQASELLARGKMFFSWESLPEFKIEPPKIDPNPGYLQGYGKTKGI